MDNEITGIEGRRSKARQAAVNDRVSNQTAGLKGEIANLTAQLDTFCKEHKVPNICKSRLYHRLFCPKRFGEWLTILIIAAIMIAAIVVPVVFFDKLAYSGLALAIDVALIAIYVLISEKTKGKYPNEVRYCRQLLDQIMQDEKGVRNVTRNIRKDTDDSPYDGNLRSFDEEIRQKGQEKTDLEAQKTSALYQFDNVTKQQIISEIDSTYAERLAEARNEAAQTKAVIAEYTQKVSGAENLLNTNYVQYVGSRNLNHDSIERMIGMLDNSEAASVTDAVTRLANAPKK